MARPSDYTPELASIICLRLADGDSMRLICAGDDMPAQSTVYFWIAKHPEFSEQYARAREIQGHVLADKAVDEAMMATCKETAQAANVRFQALKWKAGKLAPKVYGDKQQIEHSGAIRRSQDMTDDELAALASGSSTGITASEDDPA